VTKQYGGPDGTPEGSEIRRDVIDGGDESPVDDMGASYEDTTREGHGQEEAHHDRSLAETPSYPAIPLGPPLIAYPQGAGRGQLAQRKRTSVDNAADNR